jgi:hypothetical protein
MRRFDAQSEGEGGGEGGGEGVMVRDGPPTVTFGSSNLTPYIWHVQPGLSMLSAAIRARGAPGGCCWQSSTVAAAVRLGRVRVCPERGGSQGSTQFHT